MELKEALTVVVGMSGDALVHYEKLDNWQSSTHKHDTIEHCKVAVERVQAFLASDRMFNPPDHSHAISNAKNWLKEIQEWMDRNRKLQKANATLDLEALAQTISEAPLSVMVRDGWRSAGQQTDEGPYEYEILLSTGGPALRIYGELNEHNEPKTAYLQWQDWGTPWTDYAPHYEGDAYAISKQLDKMRDDLTLFASCFTFGE